jgi:hypothetical protein
MQLITVSCAIATEVQQQVSKHKTRRESGCQFCCRHIVVTPQLLLAVLLVVVLLVVVLLPPQRP